MGEGEMGEGGKGEMKDGEMGGGEGEGGNEGWERGERGNGEDLRLRQRWMPPEHSAILPLKQNSESFLDRGNGSQATHILDLTQTTHEVMASVSQSYTQPSYSRSGGGMRHLRKCCPSCNLSFSIASPPPFLCVLLSPSPLSPLICKPARLVLACE